MTPPQGRSWLRRALHWLFHLRGSPEAVALGLALGIFIAFTPALGLQTISALTLATLLGASRPAALAGTLVTNPVTQLPISLFTYWFGNLVWQGPPIERVRQALVDALDGFAERPLFDLGDPVRQFAELSREVFVPLWIGGILLGFVAGGLSYVAVANLLRGVHRRRHPEPG